MLEVLMFVSNLKAWNFLFTANRKSRNFLKINILTIQNGFINEGLIENEVNDMS